MSEIRNYKDLKIWQKGIDIAEKCYYLTKNFPREELCVLTEQIRNSSTSIPTNIAEGYGKDSTSEYIGFLNICQGSFNKLETYLILSNEVGLCNRKDIEPIIDLIQETARMSIALIGKLNQ